MWKMVWITFHGFAKKKHHKHMEAAALWVIFGVFIAILIVIVVVAWMRRRENQKNRTEVMGEIRKTQQDERTKMENEIERLKRIKMEKEIEQLERENAELAVKAAERIERMQLQQEELD